MYDAVNHGWLKPRRLRRLLASTPLPRAADGRLVLAVDVSNWLRPDAPTSPDLLFCHVYGRGQCRPVDPGWPYSFVTALETGRTSWTLVLDAVRLGPADDATAVAASQLRDVITRLLRAGQWKPSDQDILVVLDTGYYVTRLAYVLTALPTCLSSWSAACARTGSCSAKPVRAAPPHVAGSPASMAVFSPSPNPTPGTHPTTPPPTTARPRPTPWTACTHACKPVASGSTTAANST
ncbi:transposase [Streptomyces anulatus]